MLHLIAQISRRRRAGLSLKTSCLQTRRHSRGAPRCARVIRLAPQRLQRPRARVTLWRIGKPSTSPPAAQPPRPRGRIRSAADEANRGGTGKREALGARNIGFAVRAVRSSGRRAQLLPRVSRGEFRADARLRSDGTVEPRRELTEQPRPEGRVRVGDRRFGLGASVTNCAHLRLAPRTRSWPEPLAHQSHASSAGRPDAALL